MTVVRDDSADGGRRKPPNRSNVTSTDCNDGHNPFKRTPRTDRCMFGDTRADIDVEDLLKLILVLVLVWIALEIVGLVLGTLGALLGPLRPLLGLVILALIVLWFLDWL